MSKSKPRPSYTDMIDLPDDPGPEAVTVAPRTHTATFRSDLEPAPVVETETAPAVQPEAKVSKPRTAKAEAAKPAVVPKSAVARKASGSASRRELARLRRLEPKPEPADYAQRSLYARDETFERFRRLAFETGTSAQALYRKGLFLVLQEYEQADGLTPEDM